MATKRNKVAVTTPPVSFDIEARMAAAMTPAAQIDAGVNSDAWKRRRVEWAEQVPFVLAIIDVAIDVDQMAHKPVRRTDRSRLTAFRVAIETALGHYLHEKDKFSGVIADIRLTRKLMGLVMADVVEIDVKVPESLGGGLTTVEATFI
jgi:hypothetical protein